MTMPAFAEDRFTQASARVAIWIAIVTVSSVMFSLALACAAPLGALAALAGSKMSRVSGVALIVAAWAANQAVGFAILGYPTDADTLRWGVAMGIAAVLATLAVHEIQRFKMPMIAGFVAAFVVGFLVDQLGMFAATAVLPAGEGFSGEVIWYVTQINVLAYVALLALYQMAAAGGLLVTPSSNTARA